MLFLSFSLFLFFFFLLLPIVCTSILLIIASYHTILTMYRLSFDNSCS